MVSQKEEKVRESLSAKEFLSLETEREIKVCKEALKKYFEAETVINFYHKVMEKVSKGVRDDIFLTPEQQDFIRENAESIVNDHFGALLHPSIPLASFTIATYINSLAGQKVQ